MAITLTKLSGKTSVNTTVFANDHVSVLSRLKSEEHFESNNSSMAYLLHILDICGKNYKTM